MPQRHSNTFESPLLSVIIKLNFFFSFDYFIRELANAAAV